MDDAPIHGRKQRALMALARFVCRRALWIVIAAVALAVVSIVYTALELEFITDRNALVNPEAEFNQRYIAFEQTFGDQEPMMLLIGDAALRDNGVIVDNDIPIPDRAARERMKQAAARVLARLRERPDLFPEIVERIPPDAFGGTRMLYLPTQDLRAIHGQLAAAQPLIHGIAREPGYPGLLSALRDSVEGSAGDIDDAQAAGEQLRDLLRGINESLRAAAGTPASLAMFEFESSDPALDADGYMFLWGGRLLYGAIHPTRERGALDQWREPVAIARAAVAEVQADFPELAIGLSGRPVIYSDEMRASGRDMAIATIFAVLAVGLMFVLAFRSFRRPGLAVLCLLLALCWTFGVTTLVIGHLNIFAMVFAVVLVGLGIDFGIHLLSHYRHGISHGLSVHDALVETYAEIGMGTVLGAITTAAALSTAAFTDFLGLSELGLICGWGIGFCLLAMLIVFPATLVILDSRRIGEGNPALRAAMRDVKGPEARPATSRGARLAALAVALLILCAAGVAIVNAARGWAPFSYNMLELNDPDSEAVQWEKLLIEHDQRASYAVSTRASLSELRELRREYQALIERGLASGMESMLPEDEQARRESLGEVAAVLPAEFSNPDQPSDAAALRSAARGLQASLRQLAARGPTLQTAFDPAIDELAAMIELIRQRGEHVSARLHELEPQVFGAMTAALRDLKRDADPPAVTADTLPDALRSRYVGAAPDGSPRYAIYVYPAGNAWERETSGEFNDAVQAIDAKATGVTIQVYESGTRIARGFARSVLYASIAIVLLLLLDLRRPLALLIALMPVLASLTILLGLMTLTGLSFNFANFFGVAILIGTTVDAGVYLVHSQRHGDPRRTLRQTRKACLLCGMTTLLGFGALITASHQGIVSLGWVLVAGSIAGMLGSVVVVPALLAWFNERGRRV